MGIILILSSLLLAIFLQENISFFLEVYAGQQIMEPETSCTISDNHSTRSLYHVFSLIIISSCLVFAVFIL